MRNREEDKGANRRRKGSRAAQVRCEEICKQSFCEKDARLMTSANSPADKTRAGPPHQKPPRAWQRMLSGRRLDLLDPSPLDIEIEDIAHGLARVARWNGQTIGAHTFSVAQHTLLVEAILREGMPRADHRLRLATLLHDAPEYVVGDMISPFKTVIGGSYKAVERRLLGAIHVRFGLPAALPAKHGFGTYKSPNMEERYPGVQFSQFPGAEMVAKKYGLTKDELDLFGYESHQKAIRATKAGEFDKEIVPVQVTVEGEKQIHKVDEGIRFEATLEGIKGVKLLQEGGMITAATSSQICDGASGVMVVNEKGLKALGVKPIARIHHMYVMGHDPVIMLEAPVPATNKALEKAGMKIDDIDLFEVNEAFAPIPLAWLKGTKADPARLNVNGGAIALGHPLGGSGTKLMTTLLHALHQRGGRYGLQTMCEGGGLANVTIVERL